MALLHRWTSLLKKNGKAMQAKGAHANTLCQHPSGFVELSRPRDNYLTRFPCPAVTLDQLLVSLPMAVDISELLSHLYAEMHVKSG